MMHFSHGRIHFGKRGLYNSRRGSKASQISRSLSMQYHISDDYHVAGEKCLLWGAFAVKHTTLTIYDTTIYGINSILSIFFIGIVDNKYDNRSRSKRIHKNLLLLHEPY